MALSSTWNNTVTIDSPLRGGQNGIRTSGSGTGTRTLQFLNNRGKQTFTADGTLSTFAIPHSLIATPVHAQVTAGTSGARTDYHVTVGASNVNVVYPSAPANGTSLTYYWSAISS